MCGIIGYMGSREAAPVIVDGLAKLEYRGYDSAGVAVMGEGCIQLTRSLGKLRHLAERLAENPLRGTIGIGHTRWATHGRPSEKNAHPHRDCTGRIMLVHNGIIENFGDLKTELEREGHRFITETDTEVVAHLLEKYYEGDMEETFRKVLPMLRGAYALAVLCADEPDKIVFTRYESPLLVGVGKDEYFVASDVPAFLSYAREVMLIENGEIGVLSPDGLKLTKADGAPVFRKTTMVMWDPDMAEKSGYKHFMLKEIYEQPQRLSDTLKGKIFDEHIEFPDSNLTPELVNGISRIALVACGTAYHAAMMGKYFIEKIARIPVDLDVASEFRYRDPLLSEGTLFIAISQSGETADTKAAVEEARRKGAFTLAVTNVVGSSITREVDGVIYTRAGLEVGVAATKTFTAQVLVMYLIACYLAQENNRIDRQELCRILSDLKELPDAMEEILRDNANIMTIARRYQDCRDFLFLGRNINYPLALEGALKLKEISYIHAEGYAAGEMKHGPIALVDADCPVVAIMTRNELHEKTVSNIQEVAAREAHIIAVASSGDVSKTGNCRAVSGFNHISTDGRKDGITLHVISVPDAHPHLSPILAVVPLQLLSYYIADARGCDVDKPRNLAKSVTVE